MADQDYTVELVERQLTRRIDVHRDELNRLESEIGHLKEDVFEHLRVEVADRLARMDKQIAEIAVGQIASVATTNRLIQAVISVGVIIVGAAGGLVLLGPPG